MGCSALTSLRVDAMTPPTAYVNSFIDVDVEACTLYVAEGLRSTLTAPHLTGRIFCILRTNPQWVSAKR